MSELKSTPTWTLDLSNNELRLVLAALGGRLKLEHVEEARLLGNRLTQIIINNLQHHIDTLKKSLNGEEQIMTDNTKNELEKLWWKNLIDINKKLQDKGVPNDILASMSAIAIGRKNWIKMKANIARELIPIEPLPPGAVIFYK